MKIKSHAAQNELTSPFYKANEDFCIRFENYIASKNGMIKGQYNAWSYLIFGKFESSKSWDLMYKKSTFSSSGNLLLSSKSQCLLTMATWSTKLYISENSSFSIRRTKNFDFIRKLFNKNIDTLNQKTGYIINSSRPLSKQVKNILIALKPLFDKKIIYEIELQRNELTIELRSEEHHFDVLEKIL
ncbi:hypothetical protein [Psychroserpens luteus]|uniref:Uncharacterized protein n=1 Tax=Psychroserpens luteus TaxID=1434066 RepID=A0ABW5ZXN9_9FLAO|nr:hypothetical protein [Psychroserpens luteus]